MSNIGTGTSTTETPAILNTYETKSDIIPVVFNATKAYLDGMKDNERITSKDLVDKIVATTQKPIMMVSGLVTVYVHNYYPGITIKNGQNGGIIKGIPKPRIDARPRCHECQQTIPKALFEKLYGTSSNEKEDPSEASNS